MIRAYILENGIVEKADKENKIGDMIRTQWGLRKIVGFKTLHMSESIEAVAEIAQGVE